MKTIYYLYEIGIDTPRYVGQTKNLHNRFKSHKCSKGDTKRERWIREALNGGGLGVKPIECVADDVAIEREIYWTNHYNNLVNLRVGNGTSPELSAILSRGQKNKEIDWEAIRKTADKNRGQKRPIEFGQRLSAITKGVPKNPVSIQKMKAHHTEAYGIKVYINGRLFNSIHEAANETGIPRTTISAVLKGKIKNYKHSILKVAS